MVTQMSFTIKMVDDTKKNVLVQQEIMWQIVSGATVMNYTLRLW
jgi:hypothetical protein